MTNCFHCGEDDHFARECPRLKGAPKPASRAHRGVPETWCSYCDENTRLIETFDKERRTISLERCPNCHPLRFQALAQSRKCPNCNATVYEWDHGPCGCHSQPGVPLPRPATKGRPDSTRPDR